jgi:hypothetical protein
MQNLKYSIPKSVLLSQIETRIRDIFSMGTICKWSSQKFNDELKEKIYEPLNYKSQSGKRKHSVYVAGYASGIIDTLRNNLYLNDLEFCYLYNGELITTHRKSNRKTTEFVYELNKGNELADCPNGHYWKDSDKPYFIGFR